MGSTDPPFEVHFIRIIARFTDVYDSPTLLSVIIGARSSLH